ncbi:MAG TPA: DedA family protein [Gemmatimonadales bacterium]|nr:DedA family protein [Gemmatimonadales bacterium]
MSPLEDFLSRYGLVALFLIATVEGDLSILVAGVLAHLGVLPLPGVVAAGAAGNLVGDLGWFSLGRWLRHHIRENRLYRAVGPRIERLAGRLGPWQLLAARVVYGTRNASMVFWGQHGLPVLRFIAYDALGCLLAAGGFALLGYLVGHGTTALTGEVKRIERYLLAGIVAGAVLVWVIARLVRRRLDDEREDVA